jgi:hypothetical protein
MSTLSSRTRPNRLTVPQIVAVREYSAQPVDGQVAQGVMKSGDLVGGERIKICCPKQMVLGTPMLISLLHDELKFGTLYSKSTLASTVDCG